MHIPQTLTVGCVTSLWQTELNRSHAAVQEKHSNMTKLTFERVVEIAFNDEGTHTAVSFARRRHCTSSVETLIVWDSPQNRVRGYGKQNNYQRQQCWRFGGKHAPQASMFKFQRRFRYGKTGHIAKWEVCYGKTRVRSVRARCAWYSTYTADDALKSCGIKVLVCIDGTMFDMQLDTAADVSLLPESLCQTLAGTLGFG